ncbi:hypothetical protein [Pedobacter nototheniae]|uniref:hypothetical protein n=1 Tax=Pedobacter nototheniae TaxID=2488994 RepID=UPI00103F3712|nr:hypothetical protein [Pedobacter nototheniae]
MQKKPQELLNEEDPRYHAIGILGAGTACLATSEFIDKKTVHFCLPSSPALFLNLAYKAKMELEVIDMKQCLLELADAGNSPPKTHKILFDFLELMLAQAIFSFTALECFANTSIPSNYVFRTKRADKKFIEEYDSEQIERNLTLDVKFDKILPNIFEVKSPSGTKLWEIYQQLKKLRDRLIHLKSNDMSKTGPEIKTIWGDLIRNRNRDYAKLAYDLIGYYLKDKDGMRWFKMSPYNG